MENLSSLQVRGELRFGVGGRAPGAPQDRRSGCRALFLWQAGTAPAFKWGHEPASPSLPRVAPRLCCRSGDRSGPSRPRRTRRRRHHLGFRSSRGAPVRDPRGCSARGRSGLGDLEPAAQPPQPLDSEFAQVDGQPLIRLGEEGSDLAEAFAQGDGVGRHAFQAPAALAEGADSELQVFAVEAA